MVFSSLSVTLLTMYVNERERGEIYANGLVSSALKLFVPISAAIALLMCLFSDAIAYVLAPAYSIGERGVVSNQLQLLSVVAFLYCPYLILNAVLEANKVFLAGRALALFQSLLLIVAAVFFSNGGNVLSLVAAFALASVVNLIYIVVRSSKYFSFQRRAPFWTPQMKSLVGLMLPVLLGNAVLEVNSIVERGVASALEAGSVSALTYGWSVYEIVTGVVVSTLAAVLFSFFASYLAKDDVEGMTRCLEKCVITLTLVLAPLTVLTILCSSDIVSVLYMRGNFGEAAKTATSLVVSTYAIGFVPTAIRSVLTKAHYAFQDSMAPMLNGIATVICGGVGSVILAVTFGMGIAGIGVAVSISMFLSAALYQRSLARKLPACQMDKKKIVFAGKVVIATVASAVMGCIMRWMLSYIPISNETVIAIINIMILSLIIILSFFLFARILHLDELSYLLSLLPWNSQRKGH